MLVRAGTQSSIRGLARSSEPQRRLWRRIKNILKRLVQRTNSILHVFYHTRLPDNARSESNPPPPKIQMAGTLDSRFRGTSFGDVREDVESQSTAAVQSTVNSSASRSWKQAVNNPREGGIGGGEVGGEGNGGGFGRHAPVEAEVDEGEPLLCEEVMRTSTAFR